jgi:Zn2+/Cd2+-exporting ATPase
MKADKPESNKIKNPADHSVEQVAEHAHSGHDHDHDHGHDHNHGSDNAHWIHNEWLAAIVSFTLLMVGLIIDFALQPAWFSGVTRFVFYSIAYMPVGLPVLFRGVKLAMKGGYLLSSS